MREKEWITFSLSVSDWLSVVRQSGIDWKSMEHKQKGNVTQISGSCSCRASLRSKKCLLCFDTGFSFRGHPLESLQMYESSVYFGWTKTWDQISPDDSSSIIILILMAAIIILSKDMDRWSWALFWHTIPFRRHMKDKWWMAKERFPSFLGTWICLNRRRQNLTADSQSHTEKKDVKKYNSVVVLFLTDPSF